MAEDSPITTEITETTPVESPDAQAPAKKPSSKLLWLALLVQLLLIGAIIAAGFYFYQTVNQLFTEKDQMQQDATQTSQQDIKKLQQDISQVQAKVNQISESTLSELNTELDNALSRFNGFEESVKKINTRLTELSPRDEQQWMISQIEYFLKMAQYRMNLTGDHQGAALLVDQAGVVAAQLRSPEAKALLDALSKDRANLKIEGHWQPELIHAQLNALIEQIPNLTVAAYSHEDFDNLESTDILDQKSLSKIISSLVRIQKTDSAVKPLLDQTTRKQVEQHIFMLLTESQLNVMRQNQEGFESALKQLSTLVTEAFSGNRKETAFFLEEVQRLQEVQISKPTTTLDASEQALRNLVQLFEKRNRQ